MNMQKIMLMLALGCVLAGCASTGRLFTDYDPQQNFSGYKNFTWKAEETQLIASDRPINPLVKPRVKKAIEKGLIAKGYRYVDSADQADFTVAFTVGTRDKLRNQSTTGLFYSNWRWGYQYFGPPVSQLGYEYTEGTLAIDFYDVDRDAPVWHSTRSKRLTEYNLENSAEDIELAVDALLAEFPPGL